MAEKPAKKPEKKIVKKTVEKTEEKPELKTEEKTEPKTVGKSEENHILIGQKPVMKYVIACLTSFNVGSKKVVVKARGRAISRAVDTAELLRRVFMKDVVVEKIEIGTQELSSPDRPKSNVSTMEIVLTRK
ncbi:DNA-binding protein Alba [Candidatus Bathyarchaeota archaeon]|nr:DNA-binding protein Alba [Candidatus Bathyarchaeota archaeon]